MPENSENCLLCQSRSQRFLVYVHIKQDEEKQEICTVEKLELSNIWYFCLKKIQKLYTKNCKL